MSANSVIEKLKATLNLRSDKGLAEYLGIKASTIATWRHRNTVNVKLIIAKCKGIDLQWLVSEENEVPVEIISAPVIEHIQRPVVPDDLKVLYYEVPVRAGEPTPIQDDVVSFFYPAKRFHNRTFIVKVRGNSMEPFIWDGDELLVDTTRQPEEGNIVIASIYGEMTVKRIKKVDGIVLLHPDNPDYEPIMINGNVKIIGVVTKITHDALKG